MRIWHKTCRLGINSQRKPCRNLCPDDHFALHAGIWLQDVAGVDEAKEELGEIVVGG